MKKTYTLIFEKSINRYVDIETGEIFTGLSYYRVFHSIHREKNGIIVLRVLEAENTPIPDPPPFFMWLSRMLAGFNVSGFVLRFAGFTAAACIFIEKILN